MKQRTIFGLLMSLTLSIFMTAWVTWINLGWSEAYFVHWFRAFSMAWPAAFVISFVIGPRIHAVSTKLATYLP